MMLALIERGIGTKALYRCECGTEVRLFVSNVNRGHTTLTLVEWSQRSGVEYHTLMKRLDRGIPMALALSTPRYLSLARLARMKEIA